MRRLPLLNLSSQLFEGVAGLVYLFEEILIREFLILKIDGSLFPATLANVLIHEGGRSVIDIGKIEFHLLASLGISNLRSQISNLRYEMCNLRSRRRITEIGRAH